MIALASFPAAESRRRTAKDFVGAGLNGSKELQKGYQSGSRNSRPPDALAFCLRYSV
jgi:hypothetical protein